MTFVRFEVGFVSADRGLVDFLTAVFELDELPAEEHGPGTLYRLQSPGALLKVLVPSSPPKPADRAESLLSVAGLSYLSVWVTGLDGVIARAVARGGRVLYGPVEHGADTHLAVIEDPDGNSIEVIEYHP
ncbi:hypothetical protein BCD48_26790 [Pseudofrankia sp. BMG5.36]|nr:hypothetical protein BCD48_26790 [Pseudofrankia sp. BMG5.36]